MNSRGLSKTKRNTTGNQNSQSMDDNNIKTMKEGINGIGIEPSNGEEGKAIPSKGRLLLER